MKQLTIIQSGRIEAPAQFASEMWPDSLAWRKPGKCGYGSSRGLGIRMAGGACLGNN